MSLPKRLGVGQKILLDPLTIGLEQDVSAAQLADRLGGPLDHAVALALVGVDDFSGAGHLESLLGARFGLQFGHLALLTRLPKANRPCPPQMALEIELARIEHSRRHGSPFGRATRRPGYGRDGRKWQ